MKRPGIRKYTSRKTVFKRRRTYMRKSIVPRSLSMPNQVLKMKRTFWSSYFVPTTAATSNFWWYASLPLSGIPNYTEITNLFDQYKICALKYTFVPKYSDFSGENATTPGTTNKGCGFVSIIADPYSATGIPTGSYSSATYNSFAENGTVRTYNGNRTFSVYIKPTINSPQTSSTVRRKAPWLLTSNAAESHYGFHAFFHDSNFAGVFNQAWDIFVTAYLMARKVR